MIKIYRITYFIQCVDVKGNPCYQPRYDMFFKTTDPSRETTERKIALVKASVARRFPQYRVVYAEIVSEGWV